MRRSVAMAALALLVLAGCSPGIGSSADPAKASTCEEVADVAINQLRSFVDDAVGDRSYEEFAAAYDSDGGAALAAATESYSEGNLAIDARRAELGCGQDFQDLLCDRLNAVEAGGSGAKKLLAPSRETCS